MAREKGHFAKINIVSLIRMPLVEIYFLSRIRYKISGGHFSTEKDILGPKLPTEIKIGYIFAKGTEKNHQVFRVKYFGFLPLRDGFLICGLLPKRGSSPA